MATDRPKHLYYPSNLTDTSAHPAWLQFMFFERESLKDSAPAQTVDLYMPEQTSNPSTVHWGTENFGFIGNAIAKTASGALSGFDSGQGFVGSVMEAGSQGAGALRDSLGGIGGLAASRFLANAGATAANFMGGSVTAEGLMGEVAGKVPNPYLTAVFKGVDFRNFAFVFKFYPFREEDCETIYEIIRTFRAHALPNFQSEGDATFLGYPSECQISYKWQGNDNKYLPKFKRAVCTAIDVDYTSQGMFSVTRTGFPTEITMATKWSETKIVTREDVLDDTKRF